MVIPLGNNHMMLKIVFECEDCGNRWTVDGIASDDDTTEIDLRPHKVCKVCDSENVYVKRIVDPEFGVVFEDEINEEDGDKFRFICPDCLNVYWLTANVPNRCPYCRDEEPEPEPSLLQKAWRFINGKIRREQEPDGKVQDEQTFISDNR